MRIIATLFFILLVSCSKEHSLQSSLFYKDPYPTKIYLHCEGSVSISDQNSQDKVETIHATDDVFIEKVNDFKKKKEESKSLHDLLVNQFGRISFDSQRPQKLCINWEDETSLIFHPSCNVSSLEEKNCNGTHEGNFNKVTGHLYYLEECFKPSFKKSVIEYMCKKVDPVLR